ncbi:PaaI family thioesterase [Rhodococcus sp. NPDC058514]|uniref:PaaI family thioesterase n=1 Tax=unclassified Rhodococcus (in: high G+C Gram-positive bacteria) TaxID=192944 RepID=UPI003648E786
MTTSATRPLGVDPLNTMMGVRVLAMSPAGTDLEGETGPRFHDHRGRSCLASVGVLADSAVAGAFFASVPPGNRTVVSQLTAVVAAPLPEAAAITARARTEHLDLDAGTGLSTGRVATEDGTTAVSLLARSVVVTRAAQDEVHLGPAATLSVPDPEPADPESLAGLDGRTVVNGIAAGTLARGPLAGLIGLNLESAVDTTLSARFTPAPWMSNQVGSVQGGMLFAAAALTTGLAAQTLTAVGQSYRLLDLKIDFVRSPAVDGPPIRVEAEVVRAGRRIALIETRLVGADGALLARSGSSAQLGRS